MKRRDFFGTGGRRLLGAALAYFGLTSCKKKEQTSITPAPLEGQESAAGAGRQDLLKKILQEKMGKTEAEATTMLAEFEQNLPQAEAACICKTCPSYAATETEEAFCHALVGQSKVITQEKGCDCPKCPYYQDNVLKNGYYCTRKSEIEQQAIKIV